MVIHELTIDECRDILSAASYARLACARANQPYVVPIALAYDVTTGNLFSVSAPGKKITWMRRNPRVCVELENITDRFHWTTVVIIGRYEEIPASAEYRQLRERALDVFKPRSEWWLPALGKIDGRKAESLIVYRIQIDQISGRRAARPGTT
jgi:uncharacterized protein